MNTHPDPQTLRAYAAGQLAPATAMAIDAHASSCGRCRETLAAAVDPKAMRRVLARVEREGGHIAFEELSAMADGKLAAQRRTIVESHLEACGRCRREWVDLRQFAPVLARPLRSKAAPSEGLLAGLGRWFASTGGMRAVGAGVVVAVAASLFVASQVGPGGGPVSGTPSPTGARFGGGSTGEAPVPGITTGAAPTGRSVFDRLDEIAPEAVDAYRLQDFAAVAKALKRRADRGEAGALHALGVLTADGRGTPKDLAKATALLKQAAAKNDAGAADDLARLARAAGDAGSR